VREAPPVLGAGTQTVMLWGVQFLTAAEAAILCNEFFDEQQAKSGKHRPSFRE